MNPNLINTLKLKAEIKALGVTDRMRVCRYGTFFYVYLSKAVRSNAALMGQIEALITERTGRRSISAPGLFERFEIVPTWES